MALSILCIYGLELRIYIEYSNLIILRHLKSELLTQLKEYPIVTVLGPRQSGKTTLTRAALPDYDYVSLENPENREIATEDPKAFLKQYSNRVIFD